MQKFEQPTNYWQTGKALGFFLNFIKNHRGISENNDLFELVATLQSDDAWVETIKSSFPEDFVKRMSERRSRNRLDFSDEGKEMLNCLWNTPGSHKRMRGILQNFITDYLTAHPLAQAADEPFAQRVSELQKTLKLSDFELDVLLVLALDEKGLLRIMNGHGCRHSSCDDKIVFIAKCLNCASGEVRAALGEEGKLRRYQCVDNDADFNRQLFDFLNGMSKEPLANQFFKRCDDEVLPWNYYGNLADKHGAMLKRIISAANTTMPTNVLFYGAPGTGKTSFAKTLAAELGRTCYVISQHSERGGSSPEFRFGALQMCADQLDPADSLIIVDEADEMLRGGDCGIFGLFFMANAASGDKGRLNSVLDTVKVPTVWITNTPAGALDSSSRRRFDYSIEFEPLDSKQRLAIWRNNIGKMKLEHLVGDTMAEKFAARYQVSAGGITLALQNLVKLAPQPAEVEGIVEKLMEPHCKLLGINCKESQFLPAQDYSLAGLNIKGSLPLNRIVDAVRNFQSGEFAGPDRPRMNILLSGAPGTGKTEFVKYLGRELQTKVLVRMGSDLLNKYVGGTEQLIKQAFAEAEAEKAILFLDEIDGMVQSRERAAYNWEVTQVNELLYQMENFKGVMVGATNFSANLDAAILRRFTFKMEFDYLDDTGKKLFFERMFGSKLTKAECARLVEIPNLAPGDFRTVRQGYFYLGGNVTNRERLDALAHESEVKKTNCDAEKSKVGF